MLGLLVIGQLLVKLGREKNEPGIVRGGPLTYFSEKETGERARDYETVSLSAWGGLAALIKVKISDGSFGVAYPDTCPDAGRSPIGTDELGFWEAIKAEIPTLEERPWFSSSNAPRTLDILDLIEFCWRCVSKPIKAGYHDFFKHFHLEFDVYAGRRDFEEAVNRIFRRNGLNYQLTDEGQIERLAPPALGDALQSASFNTIDGELSRMLETARRKILDPDESVRREALEALWDAWERVKTIGHGGGKQVQASVMLDHAAASSNSKFRQMLEREAKELTTAGNTLQIRHSEMNQERIPSSNQIDYLFYRLFSLINLVNRTDRRV